MEANQYWKKDLKLLLKKMNEIESKPAAERTRFDMVRYSQCLESYMDIIIKYAPDRDVDELLEKVD